MTARAPGLREELRRQRLQGRAAGATVHGPRRVGRDQPLPLSFGQQRLWFLDQLEPGGTEYVVPLVLRLTGPLSRAALGQALTELVRRHEVLRTRYVTVAGEPRQVADPPDGVRVPLRVDNRADQASLDKSIAEELSTPFDLAHGPVLRARLMPVTDREHVLVLAVHHIACDGLSLDILRRELGELYAAAEQERPPALAALPVQYADYAAWQRDRATDQMLRPHSEYWSSQLAGLPQLELPTDRPRPPRRDPSGTTCTFEVPRDVGTAITEIGRRLGATPFMTFLAVFSALLGRYTGQRDLAIGTAVAGRDREEAENLVGFFVNTLVLRADLTGRPSFTAHVEHIRETVMAAVAHLDLPFERLVDDLRTERDLSRYPLVQTVFLMREGAALPGEMGALAVEQLPVDWNSTTFDLQFALQKHEDGSLSGLIQYATALFDAATVERMAGHYLQLLNAVAADPDAPVDAHDILTGAERRQLIEEWNRTEAAYPADTCLHKLIESAADRTPDAVAVRCGDSILSYRELDAAADQMAHRLMELGVRPETRVAIHLGRAPQLLPALLGVLKAGGCYVPLDPSYPARRLALILDETRAPVLVTSRDAADGLPPYEGHLVYADELAETTGAGRPAVDVDPENLAYIIYTSGSTGRPKGVMAHHRGVVHYLTWCRQAYQADDGDGTIVHSPLSFDLTVTGLFLPLICGRAVTLVPESEHPVVGLAEAIAAARDISFVKLTPAHLEPLQRCLPEPRAEHAAKIRWLVIGGEQLTAKALAFWREHVPDTMVANEYGHTETSVANVINLLPARDATATPVPVGRPIWNTSVYVVDENLLPVPVGVPGELLAGGPGVTRGFEGRPGLTAERYIANPFGPGRVYRSGDIVRYRPDGSLQFLRRADDQVKIRGYRIELGEISAGLLAHPQVTEATAVVHTDEDGGAFISAYAVPADRCPAIPDLRAHLAERLPDYMQPAELMLLERLPLTSNGKIDNAALPRPGSQVADRSAARPCDLLELRMLRLWEDVLGSGPIDVTSDFFHLGGHSMKAVTLVDRIRTELGHDLSLTAVFRARTVRLLCDHLRGHAGTTGLGCALPLGRSTGAAGGPPLFLVPPTAGNPFPYLPLVNELPDRVIYGLQAVGYDSDEEPLTTIPDIAARYVREIRSIASDGPYLLAGWSFGGSVAFEMARQLEEDGADIGYLGVIDSTVLGVDGGPPRPDDAATPLTHYGRTVLEIDEERLAGLSEDELLHEVLGEAHAQDMVPAVAQTVAVERMARVFMANTRAALRYHCTARIRADVHLIKTTKTHSVHGRPPVHEESWRPRTGGRLHVTTLPCDHWNLVEPGFVGDLAASIVAGLTRARPGPLTVDPKEQPCSEICSSQRSIGPPSPSATCTTSDR